MKTRKYQSFATKTAKISQILRPKDIQVQDDELKNTLTLLEFQLSEATHGYFTQISSHLFSKANNETSPFCYCYTERNLKREPCILTLSTGGTALLFWIDAKIKRSLSKPKLSSKKHLLLLFKFKIRA